METTSFIEKLLNGLSLSDFLAYFIMGFIGFIISVLLQFYKAKNYDIKKWWEDQKFRAILTIFIIAIGVIFQEQFTGSQVSLFGALEAGLITDVIIDRFITKKTITRNL